MILDLHPLFVPLYSPMRYKVYHGGRNGMKTFSFSEALVFQSSKIRLRIMCGRQFQGTMADSVKPAIENQIYRLGLESEFLIQDNKITNILTGSTFQFKGLERNIPSIKGWEDIDIFWGEEANTISEKAFELLTKTIRKPGSEMWFSFNRNLRTDPVDKRFLSKGADLSKAIVVKTGWQFNKYMSEEQEDERLYDLKYNPERYRHIWEGDPDDNNSENSVLPYGDLLKCVDAHKDKNINYEPSGMKHSGLDVADAGADTNAYSIRQGSYLSYAKEWKVAFTHLTASKANALNIKNDVSKMYYDISGLGAGIKSDLSRIKIDPKDGIRPDAKRFIPFNFGGKVYGAEKYFIRHSQLKMKNKDRFHKANAQAWWNLKLRMINTLKARKGEKVNLDRCLFINGDIPEIDKILAELSQCVYDDSSGKIKVDKAPNGADSPNFADSIVMAFAYDIRKGLKDRE